MDTSKKDLEGRGDVAANTGLVPQMTLQELRVKVAELCGWKEVGYDGMEIWEAPTGYNGPLHAPTDGDVLPDYPNDLNACHEAVINLPDTVRAAYAGHLQRILFGHDYENLTAEEEFLFIHATAEQRCRALVATMENRHRSENGGVQPTPPVTRS